MIPVSQDDIHHFSDGTSLVQSSVNIVDRNGFRELLSVEPVALGVVAVDELSGGSTVHERVKLMDFTSPVSVVSSSTFSLREVEPSSADAMTSLDGSCRSHFGRLFQVISTGTTVRFSDMEFCTSVDGSTVSLREHVLRFLFLHTLFFFELYFGSYLIGTTIS